MKISKRQLRRIIKEYYEDMLAPGHVDGAPWSGSLEDLASVQSKTWGHGSVVNPKSWGKSVDLARHWTNGTARSAKAIRLTERFGNPGTEDALRRATIAFSDDYTIKMGMDPGDPADRQRVKRTIHDIIASVLGE